MTLKRASFALLLVAVGVAVGVYYWQRAGGGKDDRQQIIELVANVERGVEEKSISRVMDYVSQDYQDETGNDRRTLQQLAMAAFRDTQPFDVVVQLTDLEIHGGEATLTADVEFSAGQPVGIGESTRLTVTAKLRRERGGWKVVEAEGWEGAGEEFQ